MQVGENEFHKPENIGLSLYKNGFGPFIGVPDSTLQVILNNVCNVDANSVLYSAHESQATAEAIGMALTGKMRPVVFLQNSGLGNLINPVATLSSSQVFNVPLLYLIGWRASPGSLDEPQHIIGGLVTTAILKQLNINYGILNSENAHELTLLARHFLQQNEPYAILVPHDLFQNYQKKLVGKDDEKINDLDTLQLTNRLTLEILIKSLPQDTFFITTTGYLSREMHALRANEKDLRIVGGMGLALSVAIGLAHSNPNHFFCVLDGDGAALMHLGGLATAASRKPKNLLHCLINNGVHLSTGGQPLCNESVDYCKIAQACGYTATYKAVCENSLKSALEKIGEIRKFEQSIQFLEIKTNKTFSKSLPRPSQSPYENAQLFSKSLLKF